MPPISNPGPSADVVGYCRRSLRDLAVVEAGGAGNASSGFATVKCFGPSVSQLKASESRKRPIFGTDPAQIIRNPRQRARRTA
jgi:hypothetical protein